MGTGGEGSAEVRQGLIVPRRVRRVLLGEREDGSSFAAKEEQVEASPFPGIGELFTLWGADEAFQLPDAGTEPVIHGTFPPVGGFRVFMTRFAPRPDVGTSSGDMPHDDMPSASDVHSSDTVDVNMVLSGTLDCVLSDGSRISLQAGDSIVLNGAAHAWENNSAEEALMLFFLVGANRA
tara:strand:- start:277 stop:813 length:537 start_codon:yes stop_codon:yes gene_type:complete